uniref:Ycf34 n=1 Tax=Pterocladia lucida TaxID=31408 RepID=A0A6M3WVS3_PTELU|nr:Ycf34 [Pterocladia lucida]
MCICINCRHAYNCITYNFIERQHRKKDINSHFIPIKTVISINYFNINQFEWDLKECLSFVEKPGKWLA